MASMKKEKRSKGKPVGVSACLAGMPCRYDGKDSYDPELMKNLEGEKLLPVCPEELGGLSTPRPKAWLSGGDGLSVLLGKGRVVSEKGEDVTGNFISGAAKALAILLEQEVETLYVKEKSPSCGFLTTTVDEQKVEGKGVFSALAFLAKLEIKPR